MNYKEFLVYDKRKEKDLTYKVDSVTLSEDEKIIFVKFTNRDKAYSYSSDNIVFLRDPENIDFKDKRPYRINAQGDEEEIEDVREILKFGDYMNIRCWKEDESSPNGRMSSMILPSESFVLKDNDVVGAGKSDAINYLKKIAGAESNHSKSENATVESDDSQSDDTIDGQGKNFLESELSSLDYSLRSVLFEYLNYDKKNVAKRSDSKPVIAPFSTNISQLEAIRAAIDNQISVIQGPPGTGKTQTILNLIANLLYRGETVAVVSGNNEATRNVFEKLEKEGLGVISANLGKKENVSIFMENQPTLVEFKGTLSKYSDKPLDSEVGVLEEKVRDLLTSERCRSRYFSLISEYKFESDRFELDPETARKNLPHKLSRIKGSNSVKSAMALIETLMEKGQGGFLGKLRIFLRYGVWLGKRRNVGDIVTNLSALFYGEKIGELGREIEKLDNKYSEKERKEIISEYYEISSKALFGTLKGCFGAMEDISFSNVRGDCNYYKNKKFIKRYPIVLSTTFSIRNCSPKKNFLYDYVIIDESSQVNLTSAVLALSCARNAVIVGDLMQLPHVVPEEYKVVFNEIRKCHKLPEYIDYVKYSLLESMVRKYGDNVPSILLDEHYRCDPEIIGFCNKRFYDGKLLVRTEHKKGNGIIIVADTQSFSVSDKVGKMKLVNERQARIIRDDILLGSESGNRDIGIVAPYRAQVEYVQREFSDIVKGEDILVDTVHKFQGKERSVMVLSTTTYDTRVYDDPEHIDFLNNPNLINVAISRAKDRLYVIGSTTAFSHKGTLLGDLNEYVSYLHGDSRRARSGVRSVFDLMFSDYSPALEKMRRRLLRISEFESENIIATVIKDIIDTEKYGLLDFMHNYPLRFLVDPDTIRNGEDRDFALRSGTHLDFVIYRKLDKGTKLVVEVDGRQHEKPVQKARDERKDRILSEAGICLVRIRTSGSEDPKDVIENALSLTV